MAEQPPKAQVPARFRDVLSRALSPGFARDVAQALRLDSWIGTLTGLGGSTDRTTHAKIKPLIPLTVQELDTLYHSEDLANKIVAKLPDEAFRLGFDSGSHELNAEIQFWEAASKLCEADKWGRLYGGGAVFLGLSDRLGCQDSPVDLTKVEPGDLLFLHVLDRWEMVPYRYGKTGEVEIFMITPLAPGGYTEILPGTPVHRSRMILFGGAHTSSRWRIRNNGFDLSVLQKVNDLLVDEGLSWRGVMNLLTDMSQAVFKINGLVDMISNGQKNVLLDRMEIVNMARSINRAVLIDKDGEEFSHVGAQNMTGVEPVLTSIWQRISGAADTPMTILFGMSPAGMNATGESDRAIWYANAEKHRVDITPQVRRLVRCLARNAGMDPPDTISWPSLWDETPPERADRELKEAQADQIRITAQITTPEEVREVRFAGRRWEDVYEDASDDEQQIAEDLSHAAEGEGPAAGDEDLKIEAGQLWTDTYDSHRIQVVRLAKGLLGGVIVYCCDLDAANPRAQFRWSRDTFLERCQPHGPNVA